MITIREAFDNDIIVRHGSRVLDAIVAMPGDMYRVYFSGTQDTLPGYELVSEATEDDLKAYEEQRVALTIVEQMGGLGRLRTMVNARNFAYSDNYVQFTFSGKRGINKCRVVYNPGRDLYTFELWYVNAKGTCDLKFSLDDVYFEMLVPLFEEQTGLYLSL